LKLSAGIGLEYLFTVSFFTGSDTTSAFYCKGKVTALKIENTQIFLEYVTYMVSKSVPTSMLFDIKRLNVENMMRNFCHRTRIHGLISISVEQTINVISGDMQCNLSWTYHHYVSTVGK
jgi:hypothetical protein